MANKADVLPIVLVTGFEPFGGSTLNPSQVIVESLAEWAGHADAFQLTTALLPVDTQQIVGVLDALWETHRPDIALHFGESAKAECFTLERVAINLLDFDTPDNAGQQLVDQSIDPAGEAARFVTLPVRILKDQLSAAGNETSLSLSAGAYLCNQTLYLSLGHSERRGGCAVGFVHVPSLPEQVQRGERTGPAMPREQLIQGAQRLIERSVALFRSEKT